MSLPCLIRIRRSGISECRSRVSLQNCHRCARARAAPSADPASILPSWANCLAPLLLIASPSTGGTSAFPFYCRTRRIRSGTGVLSRKNAGIRSGTGAAWEIVCGVLAPDTLGAGGQAHSCVIGLIGSRSLAGVSLCFRRGIRNIRRDYARMTKVRTYRYQRHNEQYDREP
jgi:hypothetical protein